MFLVLNLEFFRIFDLLKHLEQIINFIGYITAIRHQSSSEMQLEDDKRKHQLISAVYV